MNDTLLISLGAILGANTRHWLGIWLAERVRTGFPHGTLIINLTGSLILGFLLTADFFAVAPRVRTMFAIGFLGAYTTFSTYTYESVSLMLSGQWLTGLANLLGSAALGAGAVGLGILLAQAI